MSSQTRRELVVGALQALVLAAAVLGLGQLLGLLTSGHDDLTELAALAPLVVLAGHLLGHLRWDPSEDAPPPEPTAAAGGGAFRRFDSLDLRLRSSTRQTSTQYQTVIRPLLDAVVEDRLARHHALDWQARPQEARQLLGEQLWALLRDNRIQAPSARQLRAAVERIEKL